MIKIRFRKECKCGDFACVPKVLSLELIKGKATITYKCSNSLKRIFKEEIDINEKKEVGKDASHPKLWEVDDQQLTSKINESLKDEEWLIHVDEVYGLLVYGLKNRMMMQIAQEDDIFIIYPRKGCIIKVDD